MKKKWITGVALAALLVTMPMSAFAGSMNSNEASVYATASGTFTYEGKTYQAAPGYLSQLQAYLCRDDIDLTPEQADSAISQINSNVATGVANGYILPTDGSASGGTSAGDNSTDNDGGGSSTQIKDNQIVDDPADGGAAAEYGDDTEDPSASNQSGSDQTGSNQTVSGNNTSDGTSSAENAAAAKQQAEIDVILENRPQEETTDTPSVGLDTATGTITITDDSAPESARTATFDAYVVNHVVKIISILAILAIVTSGISVLLLWIKKAFRFQKTKGSSSHKGRKQIRKVTKPLLLIGMTCSIVVLFSAGIAQAGFFSQSNVSDSLGDSGFYRTSYSAMMDEVHTKLTEAGGMEDLCDDILTYDDFRFTVKNRLQLELAGKTSSASYEDTKTAITKAVDGIPYFTEVSKTSLADDILVIFQAKVVNGVGTMVYETKNAFWDAMLLPLILSILAAAGALMAFLCMDHYPHRGVAMIGYSSILSGAVNAVIYLAVRIRQPFADWYIREDYLYVFFYRYIQSGMEKYRLPIISIIVFGIILIFASRQMRKNRIEKNKA